MQVYVYAHTLAHYIAIQFWSPHVKKDMELEKVQKLPKLLLGWTPLLQGKATVVGAFLV